MPRFIRGVLYYSMFPLFVSGAMCFYATLRIRLARAREADRPVLARAFIHNGARLLFFIMRSLSLVRVSFEDRSGASSQRGPAVVVANHPSMLDALLLLSVTPNAVCVMKRGLMRVPVIAGFAKAAGYVPQGDAPEMMAVASDALASGASLIIFPEGTRSPEGALGEFRRGAARIAVEAKRPIDLVIIEMNPVVLGPARGWLKSPESLVGYRAVRMAIREAEIEPSKGQTPEGIREESIRLTRYLEDRVRSSLSLAPKVTISGTL